MKLVHAITTALLLASACGKSDPAPAGGAAGGKRNGGNKLEYPVDVATVATRDVQYSVSAPGSIDAFQQVQITARVAGAVDKVSFSEGQVVAENDVLAEIESERYQSMVDQAKIALTRAASGEKTAESALSRRKAALTDHPGLIPGEEIEQKQAAVDTAKADVDTAKQGLHVAELNLRDSYVRTPIAGVVQTRTVQTGQYLQPGAVLATILQRDPLLLRFQVSEADAPRLKTGMIATLSLRESSHIYSAKITLVSGAADATTRLVSVTAEVDDKDHQYWLRPGAFCEVTVPVGSSRKAIVVPTLAVQPTEKGNMVYVVDAKNQARSKIVQLGMHTADGGVEVTRGLAEGDQLVVRGVEPLTEGAPVKVASKTTLEAAQRVDAGAPAVANAATDNDTNNGANPPPPGSDTAQPELDAGVPAHHRRAFDAGTP